MQGCFNQSQHRQALHRLHAGITGPVTAAIPKSNIIQSTLQYGLIWEYQYFIDPVYAHAPFYFLYYLCVGSQLIQQKIPQQVTHRNQGTTN